VAVDVFVKSNFVGIEANEYLDSRIRRIYLIVVVHHDNRYSDI
jgi:hypothetical protein